MLLLEINDGGHTAARVRMVNIAVDSWNFEFLKHVAVVYLLARHNPASTEHV